MSLERTTELELTGFSIELSTDGGKSYGLPLSGDLSERNYEYARTGKEILDGCTNDRYFDPQSFDGEVPKEDGDGNICLLYTSDAADD